MNGNADSRSPPPVRRAAARDSNAAAALLVRSIRELCVADHHGDQPTLERWLRNKTPREFERWLANIENFTVVAELGQKLAGVALLHDSAEIRLCYVMPGAERAGVGKALLGALEAEARRRGLSEVRLQSSGNARPFYEYLGYLADGPPTIAFGVLQQYPYRKPLSP